MKVYPLTKVKLNFVMLAGDVESLGVFKSLEIAEEHLFKIIKDNIREYDISNLVKSENPNEAMPVKAWIDESENYIYLISDIEVREEA